MPKGHVGSNPALGKSIDKFMQTFLPYTDIRKCAEVLDNKRLGKQRVETVQILNALLNPPTKKHGWHRHPAVLMWRGYEAFLCKVYLKEIIDEWVRRGFDNTKCGEHYANFLPRLGKPIAPHWLNEELCITHRSRLIQKDPEFYRPKFPGNPEDLGYLWPR